MNSMYVTMEPFNSTMGVINTNVPIHQAMASAKLDKEEKKLQLLKMEARIKKL